MNLVEALARELVRVVRIHERNREIMRTMPELAHGIQIMQTLMGQEIEQAVVALGTANDPVRTMRAYEALKGYEE